MNGGLQKSVLDYLEQDELVKISNSSFDIRIPLATFFVLSVIVISKYLEHAQSQVTILNVFKTSVNPNLIYVWK